MAKRKKDNKDLKDPSKNKKGKDKDKKDKDKKDKGIPPLKKGLLNKLAQYDYTLPLSEKDLKKSVKSQVNAQIKPVVSAYQNQADVLKKLMGMQTKGLEGYGKAATGKIEGYYNALVNDEAQKIAQQGVIGQRAVSGVQGARATTTQALSDASTRADQAMAADPTAQYQVQPSDARAELQAKIAEQQGLAAREGQALEGQANNMAGSWNNIIQGISHSSQTRLGGDIADLKRDVLGKIAETQMDYAPDIRDALAKVAEAKSSRGDIKRNTLNELIDRERNYGLSRAALRLDKQTTSAEGDQATQSQKAQQALAEIYGQNAINAAKANQENIKVQGRQSRRTERTHGEQSRAYLDKAGEVYGGGKGKGDKQVNPKEYQQAVDVLRAEGGLEKIDNRGQYQKAIGWLVRSHNVNHAAAVKALKKLTPYGRSLKAKKKNKGKSTEYTSKNPGYTGGAPGALPGR